MNRTKKVSKKSSKNLRKNGNKGEKDLAFSIFKTIIILAIIFVELYTNTSIFVATERIYESSVIFTMIIKIVAILYLINRHDDSAYKISWILFISFFPITGVIAYLLWGNSKLYKYQIKNLKDIDHRTQELLKKDENVLNELKEKDQNRYLEAKYIETVTSYPVYNKGYVEYFELGDYYFESMLNDLKKAKKYILIQSYIISNGKLANDFIEILKQKASEGVKIIILFDALGSFMKLPKNFVSQMQKLNIEVHEFNPLAIFVNGYMNSRNHRKFTVIDGVIAYTGGVNIADEYANIIEKYGHWKDNGLLLYKEVALSYLVMFLRTLEHITKKRSDYAWYMNGYKESLDFEYFSKDELKNFSSGEGYMASFADGPDNRKRPTENAYVQLINFARNYIYMTTPYLAISEELLAALLNSARSGVDVRIIVPKIPDKKFVNIVTKSYYEVLLEAGVKIYEYTPGFMHSKSFVSDNEAAIIGTANLDYRSLHLNFESSTWLYATGIELKLKSDYLKTLEVCKEIRLNEWKRRPIVEKIFEVLLKVFAPMM